MPSSSRLRSLTSFLLRGAAWLIAAAAGLSLWVGGRALHEFAKFDRLLGEVAGLVFALTLFGIAALLKGMADSVEHPDHDEPVGLAIGAVKESEKPR